MRRRYLTPILSYSSHYGSTFEDFIRLARDRGFGEVQITPDQSPNLYSSFTRERAQDLRRLAEDLEISLHVHNVFYDINIVSLVPDVSDLALEVTRRVLDLAHSLNARSVTIHAGYMFGGWRRDTGQRERFWKSAADAFAQVGEMARARDVKILVENGSYFVTTATGFRPMPLHIGIEPAELKLILEMIGNGAGVAFDINKAIHSSVPPTRFMQELGIYIGQLQISTVDRYQAEIESVLEWLQSHDQSVGCVLEGSKEESERALTRLSAYFG